MSAVLGESAEISERIAHDMAIQREVMSQALSNRLVLSTTHLTRGASLI